MSDYRWFDELRDVLVTPAGGDQLAAKSTAMTPWGAPGVFAEASSAPTDGGWIAVDVQSDYVDLVISTDPDIKSYVEVFQTPGSGAIEPLSFVNVIANQGSEQARVYASAHVTAADTSAVLSAGISPGGEGVAITWSRQFGSKLRFVLPADGQGPDVMEIVKDTDTGTAVLNVTATGDIVIADPAAGVVLHSPDGTGYRLTVANGGALTAVEVVA